MNVSLINSGVAVANIFTTTVPTLYDLPITSKLLAASKRIDVIINLGCVQQHTDVFTTTGNIESAVALSLMQVGILYFGFIFLTITDMFMGI